MDQFSNRFSRPRFEGQDFQENPPASHATFPPRYAATDGLSASGGLTPGAHMEDGLLWMPIPTLGPMTRVMTLDEFDGKSVAMAWDTENKRPSHMEGPYAIGQLLDGTPVKFL